MTRSGITLNLTLTLYLQCTLSNCVLCTGPNIRIVKVRDCEPIQIEQCKGLGYNVTGMPNLAGHDYQDEAKLQISTFRLLIENGCSSQLRFFLCSVYAPMCFEKVKSPIRHCRPICLSVKAKCLLILKMFGFPWPALLNCSHFPARNDNNNMCMDGPKPTDDEKLSLFHPKSTPDTKQVGKPRSRHEGIASLCSHIKNGMTAYYFNNVTDPAKCSLICHQDDLFSKCDKRCAEVWICIWTALCFAATLFAVLTFLVDPHRFHYPEKVVVIMALCYNFCSIGYLVRLVAGRDAVACETVRFSNNRMISEGLQNTNCTIVFLLLYYFASASCIWWIVLSLNWFLSASLKWSHEAIQRHSSYFHLAAWALPAIKTIVILIMRNVDADELTGMCIVGFRNPENLLGFQIIPLLIYLVIGTVFLFAGSVGLVRIQRLIKQNNGGSCAETDRLELLMVQIGVFSVLYIVTNMCVLTCYNYNMWHDPNLQVEPNVGIFMLKIFMSLLVGIATGMWMLSQRHYKAGAHSSEGCAGVRTERMAARNT